MNEKISKRIFVIMPFVETPTRDKNDLNHFFEYNIKEVIEKNNSFQNKYLVERSAETFGITEKIIIDLYEADILICDLSGERANPNVMYELGIRLSISNKPVILIREEYQKNKDIFDIDGYYTFIYNPKQYKNLENHLIQKISNFEKGVEKFYSPIQKILKNAPTVIEEIIKQNNWDKLVMFQAGIYHYMRSLYSSVSNFIIKRLDVNDFETDNSFLEYLWENENELTKLKWSDYELEQPQIPALESFLTHPPLSGLKLDDNTHQRVLGYVLYYYNFLVVRINTIYDKTYIGIRAIIRETSLLNQLAIELVTSYVVNTDLNNEINKIIDKSGFRENIPAGVVMIRIPER